MSAQALLLPSPGEAPTAGQPVTIEFRDGRSVTSLVRSVASHRITVDRPAGDLTHEVLVTWSSGRRVHTTEARILPTAGSERVDLAFGAIRGVDRRSGRRHRPAERFRVDFRVASPGDGVPRATAGTLVDLSASGLAARSSAYLEVGTVVDVAVHGPSGGVIVRDCPARVVRAVELVGSAWLIAVELDLPPIARGFASLLETVLAPT